METLENYLNLSKEICPLNTLIPPSTTNNNNNNNTQDDVTSITDNNNPTSSTNLDTSISTNETNSISTPVANKKLSRPSFNSFSKIIRRTFIEPFSSVKRTSLKQQRQHQNIDTSDASNENEYIRRVSSPLLNRRTNILTIIVTNFQPKRPKTCDNMIKNYIDACMNEYRLEKNRKQMNETSINENENNSIKNNYSDWNNDLTSYQQPTAYNRYQSNRYQQNISSNEKFNETSTKKLPSVPINSTNKINSLIKHVQKNDHMDDDNDDSLPMENGQFSSNINYVQQTQRKSSQITQVIDFFIKDIF
jgi:hypothetical protein